VKRFLSYLRAYRLSLCRSTNAMKKNDTMHLHQRRLLPPSLPLHAALAAACLGWLAHAATAQAQTLPLNDTGITWSGNYPTGNSADCQASPAGQDCHYGRDKAAADGVLGKVGKSAPDVDPAHGSPNGFDFTKISNSGDELPHTAALGYGPGDWACTRDNVTGLVWEIKTPGGLRGQYHFYTWFDSNPTTNGGSNGTESGGTCATTGRCDTEKFVADVNQAGLCGASDWRMPTRKELLNLVNLERVDSTPLDTVDPVFFRPLMSSSVWSGSPYAGDSGKAWGSSSQAQDRSGSSAVVLVRGGQ